MLHLSLSHEPLFEINWCQKIHVKELRCAFSVNRYIFGVDLGDYNFTWLSNCVILNLVSSCSIREVITLTFKQLNLTPSGRISCGYIDLTSLQGWDFYCFRKLLHGKRRTLNNASSSASLTLNEKKTGNLALENRNTFLVWKDNLSVELN